jgi:hypothetical protein
MTADYYAGILLALGILALGGLALWAGASYFETRGTWTGAKPDEWGV